MSRATSDDQLKFLLSCVRHSNNGKIDFVEVAKECGVVSKGAAAKRYERLLKANGIHPSGGPADKYPSLAPKQKSKADIIKSAAAKRRKIEGDTMHWQIDDEDEFKPYLKHEPMDKPHIKPEPGVGILPYPVRHQPSSIQSPFFAGSFAPPMSAHLPYTVTPHPPQLSRYPFSQVFQSVPQRIPLPNPQPLLSTQPNVVPPTLQQPMPTSQPPPNTESSPKIQPPPLTRPPQSVTEEQIDSMFAEFCAQDMLRSTNFEASSSAQAQDMASGLDTTAQEQPGLQPQVSPETNAPTVPQSFELEPVSEVVKEEQAVQQVAVYAVERPSGVDAENSILIVD